MKGCWNKGTTPPCKSPKSTTDRTTGRFQLTLIEGVVALALAAVSAVAVAQAPFSFAVFGDTPYHGFEVAAVEHLLREMDGEDVAFVVHVGDLKASTEPCSDQVLRERRDLLDASLRPLVFAPGDNDWTDCHRESSGGYDPRERLDRLRTLFFPGDESLGRRKLRLVRQSDDESFRAYRENARWIAANVVFATLNVPGSNNNFGRTAFMDTEHAERMRANLAWLAEAVALAQRPGMRGLVVLAHGEPRFGAGIGSADGFAAWRDALRLHATALVKPMLLIHGDGHRFRVDQPLRDPRTRERLANFTRVEVFGSPTVGWVRIDVRPEGERLFAISPGGGAPPAQ